MSCLTSPGGSCCAADGEDPEEARQRMPRPSAAVGKSKGSSGSLFSRAFTSLISIEGSDPAAAAQVGGAACANPVHSWVAAVWWG